MKSPCGRLRSLAIKTVSLALAFALLVAPVLAQRPAAPAKASPPPATAPRAPEPTFDNLLGADRYKLYGEVRNIGQLMSNGGMVEIVDPIIKLASPPPEFNSIIKFLKSNTEALATARLLFATWPARTDVPNAFVAIEFGTNEEAARFAPKLESFLPTVLPPVPEPTPETVESPAGPAQAKASTSTQPATAARPKKESAPVNMAPPAVQPSKPVERLPFVISHTGNLVLISDKAFKFETLHPLGTKSLFEDQNFRVAHDRFSAEPIFLFFNVVLEEKRKAIEVKEETRSIAEVDTQPSTEAEAELKKPEEVNQKVAATDIPSIQPTPNSEEPNEAQAVLARVDSKSEAVVKPTKEQQAQASASNQIGHMLDSLGFGEPQWPEAVGLALVLDNQDYVIKALLIDPPNAKKLPLPFVPQLISGPAYASEAPSVLPDDTEIFVTASIDLLQTYEGMRTAAELKTRAEVKQLPAGGKEPLDTYAEFEKKAGFNIRNDLLPAFGNEITLAGSLRTLQSAGFGIGAKPVPSVSPEKEDGKVSKDEKDGEAFPMLLLAVKDREAARRLMPHVLDGLGFGEANLIAQVEKREDTEMVNYAGIFAYAFVGNFLVISEAATVRRVIDASVNHQTLSSNAAFRNSRRWEPARTLGQIYISPALMAGYHDEIRRQAATIDPEMRDFLLGLDPTASAITYALSNDGLGTQHEIHLPKNLILTTVAGISSATKNPPPEMNEGMAIGMLQMIAGAETTYQSTTGKGKYATLDELIAQKLVTRDFMDKYGYNFEVTVMGDQFQAVATPREYGKTGKRSFFVDKTSVVRGDDHGGAPASAADKPVQE